MSTTDESRDGRDGDGSSAEDVLVTVHRSSPDRFVFTEDGNTDAWISSDLTAAIDR